MLDSSDALLELKEVRFSGKKMSAPDRKDLADELVAFANGRGGICLLGVNDHKEIVGIPLDRLDQVESLVLEVCRDSAQPPLQPIISRMYLPNSRDEKVPVLKVEIPKPPINLMPLI